ALEHGLRWGRACLEYGDSVELLMFRGADKRSFLAEQPSFQPFEGECAVGFSVLERPRAVRPAADEGVDQPVGVLLRRGARQVRRDRGAELGLPAAPAAEPFAG